MKLPLILLKIRQRYFPRFAGKYDFNEILRADGIEVGEGTIFYNPNSMSIDRQRPWMLKIGRYCKITKGTVILTHDYSRSVLRRAYGPIVGEAGETIIGDNVFIGMNSVILMGAHIGNNVIVGAGSVVGGTVPDNCVVAGNPARVIRTLDEHYRLRTDRLVREAGIYVRSFIKAYGRDPQIHECGPFFPLFLERSEEAIRAAGVNVDLNGDVKDEVVADFLRTEPLFPGYEVFMTAMKQEQNEFWVKNLDNE